MKKIFAILMAVFAIAVVSCSKEDLNDIVSADPQENDSETIKINITFPGETKAAKNAWVAGDKLNIWFQVNESTDHLSPDLVITYDGSTWKAGSLRSGATLSASGDNMTLLYEGHNNIISCDNYNYYNGSAWYSFYAKDYHNVYSNGLIFYAYNIKYTYSDNTLSATISEWQYATRFKVLIKNNNNGMIHNPNEYILQVVNNSTDPISYPGSRGAIVIRREYGRIDVNNGSSNYEGRVSGFQEADGIAFYYTSFNATNADITFSLRDINNGTVKTYSVTNKTIAANQNCCTGIVLNYSSFN